MNRKYGGCLLGLIAIFVFSFAITPVSAAQVFQENSVLKLAPENIEFVKPQIEDKSQELSPAQKKLSTDLLNLLYPDFSSTVQTRSEMQDQMEEMGYFIPAGETDNKLGSKASSDLVYVYIYLKAGSASELDSLVWEIVSKDDEEHLMAAWVELNKLEELGELNAVQSIYPVLPPICNAGSVTSEGDALHKADQVRESFGADGTGIKVGVISDGVNSWQTAKSSGDLPADFTQTNILNDRFSNADEGTAMLEIVYDLAPGAELYFHDCGSNYMQFCEAIDALVANGCTVICDDIGWITEPFFEDGYIASYVDQLIENNDIIYISSAGNAAMSHYQGEFVNDGGWHDFNMGDPLHEKNLVARINPGGRVRVILEWNDKWEQSNNNYDLYLFDYNTGVLLTSSEDVQDGNDLPLEFIYYENNTSNRIDATIAVYRCSGEAKQLEVYGYGNNAGFYANNLVSQDSIFGHPAVPGVISTGAIDAENANNIAGYSSQGPVSIYYPNYEQRAKPDLCGIAGVQVTGAGGFPSPFYGTSAAAPHLAAITALSWSKFPELSVEELRQNLLHSSVDKGEAGFDNTYGYGLADALESIKTQFPSVSMTDPIDKATDIAVNQEIEISFSEVIQEGDSFASISLKDVGDNDTTITKNIQGNILRISADSQLEYDTLYTVNIPATAVKDQANYSMLSDYSFSFTTHSAKEISSVASIDDINVDYGTAFSDIALPATAEVILDDDSKKDLNVNWVEEGYDGSTAGEYTIEGNLELVAGIANSGGHKAKVKVIVGEAPDKEINSVVSIDDINVAYGTAFANIGLPATAEVILDDDSKKDLNVNWVEEGYDGSQAGEYNIEGNLELVAGIANSGGHKAKVKVIVAPEPDKEIKSVASIADINVDYGTAFVNIGLPATAEVILDDDSKKDLNVSWLQGNYDGSQAGEYNIKGDLQAPAGIVNPNKLQAEVKVIVSPATANNITEVETLSIIQVVYDTSFFDIPFPDDVYVTLNDNSNASLEVDWLEGSYDGKQPGNHTLFGELVLKSGIINPNNIQAQADVMVGKPSDKSIVSVESIDSIQVSYGTLYRNIKLPEQVTITLEDQSRSQVNVNWSSANYNGSIAGTYTIFGELQLKEGIINPQSLTALIDVIVKNKDNGGGSGGSGGGGTGSGFSIKSEGGTASKYGVKINVPSGAISQNIRVTISKVNKFGLSIPENSLLIGDVVDISKNRSGDFEESVSITMSFDSSQIDFEQYTLSLFWYNEKTDKWEELDNVTVDHERGIISGQVNHFTKFAVLAATKASETSPVSLKDIKGHWAENYIINIVEKGIAAGDAAGTFRPDENISREEFCKFIVLAAGLDPVESSQLKFIDSNQIASWAIPYVAAAVQAGIINGYEDESFKPQRNVNRAEIAVMVMRTMGQKESGRTTLLFNDADAIPGWALYSVAEAVDKEIISGFPDNTFRAGEPASRAQAAKIISQMIKTK